MKATTIISIGMLAVGIYLTYTKDSSFQSVDIGSVLIGGGVGLLIGEML